LKKIVCILGLLLPVMLFPQKVIKIKNNFVLIDTDQNIGQIGDIVPLYRNESGTEKKVGRVEIVEFKNKMCACNVVSGTIILGDYCQTQLENTDVMGDKAMMTMQAKGQMAAINKQLASSTIKNVLSEDLIQEIPDANVAESVGRLPGISVIRSAGEGQKVAIRGMEPKYNVIMVNGVRMQSSDPEDRSFDLNLIVPNTLSGIEVKKVLTADMGADAVGGTVNLMISKAKPGFHSNFSLQGGYGSLTDTYGNYKMDGSLSNRFFENKLGVQATGFYQSYDRSSDDLYASFGWHGPENDPDNYWLEDTEIRDNVTDRKRFGGSLVLDYQLSNGTLMYSSLASRLSNQSITQQNDFLAFYRDWSGYARDSESKTTVFNNALQGEFDFDIIKMDFTVAHALTQMRLPGEITMRMGLNPWVDSPGWFNPDNTTKGDEIHMTPVNFINTVEATSQRAIRNLITLTRDNDVSAVSGALNFEAPFNFGDYFAGNVKVGGKYAQNTRKNDETLYIMNTATGIDVLAIIDSVKSLWESYFGYELTDPDGVGLTYYPNFYAQLFEYPDYDVGDFLSGIDVKDNIFTNLIDISKMHDFEEFAQNTNITYDPGIAGEGTITNTMYQKSPRESFQNDYNYSRSFMAFYLMPTLNIGKYVTFIPGIRYEKYDYDYTAYNIIVEDRANYPGDQSYYTYNQVAWDSTEAETWFPQIQLKIKPLDWLYIRLASTKSIIYPDYRAVSPYLYADNFSAPVLELGNPYLKPAITQNYDVNVSVYNNHIGLFSAGYFYKKIDDLIVPITYYTKDRSVINNRYPLSESVLTDIDTWTNLEDPSYVDGFELDWQTHFWYLPSPLNGLVFSINYTKMYSESYYNFIRAKRTGNPPFYMYEYIDTTRTGRLVDQADDILNFMIGYDIGGFSARLSYLYQNDVLEYAHNRYAAYDEHTKPYSRWDFTAYQKLPWLEGLQVFLNINNITNEADLRYRNRDIKKYLSHAEYYGTTADFGIRYKF